MQKLKVAFFGTSDRSLPILEALNQNFSLMFTVTKEDSKVGRDQKTKETGVKTWSKEHGIKVIEVQKLTPEISSTIISQLIKDGVVFVVVADFSLMIPKEFLNRSDFRVINIHFSLLPTYRGASPVQFALLNGNQTTGVTFQFVEAKMDTGNIIQQIPYPIDIDDTTETLNNKLFVVAAKELPNVLANSLKETVQDESKATYTYSKTKPKTTLVQKEDAKIDWNQDHFQIHNSVRAFYPWPIAWTTLGELAQFLGKSLKMGRNPNLKVKILETSFENNKMEIKKVTVEGAKTTGFKDFLNGYFDSLSS